MDVMGVRRQELRAGETNLSVELLRLYVRCIFDISYNHLISIVYYMNALNK